MADNIKLLEELVVEAVDRLRELTRERDELQGKVASLSKRLDALKRKASQGVRSSDDARAREARQWSCRRKRGRADFTVDNSGDLDRTRRDVERALRRIEKRG